MSKKVLITLDGSPRAEAVLGILGDVCSTGDELLLLCFAGTQEATLTEAAGEQSGGAMMSEPGILVSVPPPYPEYAETTEQATQGNVSDLRD